jgi:membrane-associated phospholipid phosphatase
VAFTIATALSSQYKGYGVIPVISYSLAGMVGLSRINDNKHFASDVLAGASLGIASARWTIRIKNRFKQKILGILRSLSVIWSRAIQRLKERIINCVITNHKPGTTDKGQGTKKP